jgi:predicted type IV restriction endonuclease
MIEKLQKEVSNIVGRAANVQGRGEEATKQALVLPWLHALGYDIWSPNEVCPEFESDTAIKKAGQKEKVDLALLRDGMPVVFIEVKPFGESLIGHHGQLKRYFNSTTSVALGVLTNGMEYRFFTDSAESNIMDDEPFFISRLDTNEPGLEVVVRFSKKTFSSDAIRNFATELKFTARIDKLLTEQLDLRDKMPSESFVRWVLGSEIYDGRITANVVERFAPITKEALQRVQMRLVRLSIAKMEEGVSSAEHVADEIEIPINGCEGIDEDIAQDIGRRSIITTDEELQAFVAIRELAGTAGIIGQPIYDPARRQLDKVDVAYRDTTGYFSVYMNKTSWWCTRLNFDAKQKWIGFPIEFSKAEIPAGFEVLPQTNVAAQRVQFSNLADLKLLQPLILKSMQYVIDERNAYQPD